MLEHHGEQGGGNSWLFSYAQIAVLPNSETGEQEYRN
jgi:hypothetical protein